MRSHFFTFTFVALLAPPWLQAQAPPTIPAADAVQIVMQPQSLVEYSTPTNITATAEFDPPVVSPGEKAYYRVAVEATQNSIGWPVEISLPPGLRLGAATRGQLTQPDGTPFHPLTEFLYEATSTNTGRFVISNFVVSAGGRRVEIPAATLDVGPNALSRPPRKLALDVSETNIYLGQPVRVRVLLPAGPGNEIEALRDVQFIGGALMAGKTTLRQSVEVVNRDGELKPAFIYEVTATPLAVGPLEFSAQAFTAGRDFSGPISISGQVTLPGGMPKYVLLVSGPMKLNVRPVPADGELPGFTGALGKFTADPPLLSTNQLRVGEPVRLKAGFHSEGSLTRFVPPEPPRSSDWQIIADNPPGTAFTLIPLTDEARATPAIPFCAFDPAEGIFVDLTIPALPVTVVGESLPTELRNVEAVGKTVPLKLSGLAVTPGKTVSGLQPPQLRGWLVGVQFLPVVGFVALWQWDRRRRFLEAHPEIVRQRQALRALRRERILMQQSVAAGDVAGFVRHAANAMQAVCAPNFPAHPQALVCGDVLAQFDGVGQDDRAPGTVRIIFAAADSKFASQPPPRADLTALLSDVENVLEKLEAKL